MKLTDMAVALDRDEIRLKTEVVDGVEVSIACYMIATPDLWDVENAIESRGITFDADGNCIARPMEKFFNINENKFTQLLDLNFDDSIAYDKLDGSMITVVKINGALYCKSKKTFFSPVAIQAQNYLNCNENLLNFCEFLLQNRFSPTFEFTSFDPQFQIVIPYTEEKMTFLLARHLETGEYLSREVAQANCQTFGIAYANGEHVSNVNEFLETAKTVEGIEGWVINLQDGRRVKLKTQWYLTRHRITNYTARNIFDLIISEEIDDLMPILSLREGATETVNEIGHKIAHAMKNVQQLTEDLVADWVERELTLSYIGKNFSGYSVFHLAIKLFKGQEPNYKEFLVRNFRNEFSTNALFLGSGADE